MSFPTTSILDNFNRANEGPPPSANWSSPVLPAALGLQVLSNQLASNNSGSPGSSYWSAATFGPDCEVYATITDAGGERPFLFIRMINLNSSSASGYFLWIKPASSILTVYRMDSTVNTALGADISQAVSNGDSVGMSIIGDTITVYYKAAAGSWTALDTRIDATYSAAGRIGVESVDGTATGFLDDFGGGTIGGGGGTTWYVRSDGGTATQSTGLVDAAYPGSGTGTASAFNNPQDAFDAAALGDVIQIRAGDSFSGNFTLDDKGAGSSYITVQSSAISSLTAGVRVSPTSVSDMPTLSTPNSSSALSFLANSHHWQFFGIAITTTNAYPSSERTPFLISEVDTVTFNTWPHDLIFDRMLVYAAEDDPLPYRSAEEGFAVNGADITIKNSYIYNFMGFEYPSVARTITAATNTSPVQVEFSSTIGGDPGHKFLVYLDGATGNWTPLNGPAMKVGTWVDSTHATLETYDQSTFALSNLDSSTFGSFAGQAVNQMSSSIATSRGILIGAGPGPYTIDNNFIEAYYTPLFFGGGGTWIDPQNVVSVTGVTDLATVTLDGLGELAVDDLIAFSTMQDQTITGATAGNPTSLTVQTMRYPDGTLLVPEGCIEVSGFTGSWAPLNGSWGGGGNGCGTGNVFAADTTHITIPVDSTGFGAVTSSSPKWVVTTKNNSGAKQWQVGKVTGISGSDVTTEWWGHQPDNTNGNGNGILVAVGATAQFLGVVIHDVTVTHCTISVRRSWIWLLRDVAKTCDNCSGQPPKASLEAKMGNNITFNGNIFQIEGGDLAPNSSTVSIGLNQANQVGSTPWVSLINWAITNNIFYNYTYMKMSMVEEYETGVVSSGMNFSNNLFSPANASYLSLEGTDDFNIIHNTVRNFGTGGGTGGGYNGFIVISGIANTNTVIKDNIGNWVTYGYLDFSAGWTPLVRTNDYYIDNQSVGFTPPTNDFRVADDTAMGFVDVANADAGGDYHGYALTALSVGHNAASDGKDVGVDFALLDAALNPGPVTSKAVISFRVVLSGTLTIGG